MKSRSPRVLIDTNWMADYLSGVEEYRAKFEEIGPDGLAVSVVTMTELYEGVVHSRDPARSQQALDMALTDGISVLTLNDEFARRPVLQFG